MAKKITINVSGDAEKFLNRMVANHEISEEEVFALALGLLKEAVEDKVVAKVEPFDKYKAQSLIAASTSVPSASVQPSYYVVPQKPDK